MLTIILLIQLILFLVVILLWADNKIKMPVILNNFPANLFLFTSLLFLDLGIHVSDMGIIYSGHWEAIGYAGQFIICFWISLGSFLWSILLTITDSDLKKIQKEKLIIKKLFIILSILTGVILNFIAIFILLRDLNILTLGNF